MAKDIKEIWHTKEKEEKEKKVKEFQEKYKEHLDKLIDPAHPDFGPKNNQLLWIHGRLKSGRSEFLSALFRIPLAQRIFTATPRSVRVRSILPARRCPTNLILTRKIKRPSGEGGKEVLLAGRPFGSGVCDFCGRVGF